MYIYIYIIYTHTYIYIYCIYTVYRYYNFNIEISVGCSIIFPAKDVLKSHFQCAAWWLDVLCNVNNRQQKYYNNTCQFIHSKKMGKWSTLGDCHQSMVWNIVNNVSSMPIMGCAIIAICYALTMAHRIISLTQTGCGSSHWLQWGLRWVQHNNGHSMI